MTEGPLKALIRSLGLQYPQHVDIKEDGTGFLVEACVASTNKLTLRSGTSKEELPKICAEDGPEGEPVPKKATSTFRAPCSITLCRR